MKNIIFILLISLPLIWPLTLRGHLDNDDGVWAMVRQAEMHREMKDLQFPPRWAGYLNHGYGYPLFLFAYPLPYLIGEVFMIAGVGPINTVKLLFGLSAFLSLVTMYIFAKSIWGEKGAFLSTVLYAYGPYRLTNLYQRGNLGELWAFVFFPLLLYLYKQLIATPSRSLFLITSIVTALFLLNHNASVVLFAPILATWIGWQLASVKFERRRLITTLLTGIAGLSLSSWFWVPAVVEKKYVALSISPLTYKPHHFLDWSHLLLSKIHENTSLILSLGNLHLVIVFIALLVAYRVRTRVSQTLFFLFVSVISIGMVFPISEPIWNLPLLKEIDFPWRMLGITLFGLSVVGGQVSLIFRNKYLIALLAGILIVVSMPRIMDAKRIERTDAFYETNDATTTSADELQPIWVQEKPQNRQSSIFFLPTVAEGAVITDNSNRLEFRLTTIESQPIILNRVYFPGWTLRANGKDIAISENRGLISFASLPGTNIYDLRFEKTMIRSFADLLSLSGITVLGFIWIFSKKLRLFS